MMDYDSAIVCYLKEIPFLGNNDLFYKDGFSADNVIKSNYSRT
jgi:hypothetical protein